MNEPLFDIALPNQEKYPGVRLVGYEKNEQVLHSEHFFDTIWNDEDIEIYKLLEITEYQAKDWGFDDYKSEDHYKTKPASCIDELKGKVAIEAFKGFGYKGDLNNILLILIKK